MTLSIEFDAKKLFKMYKAASKDLKQQSTSKTASPEKNQNTKSPGKKSKDASLSQNGNDEKNKSLKKKKKDKDKERDKEKDKESDNTPKSERFMKIDQGNNKPPINKHKPPLGLTAGNHISPAKRKREENEAAGSSASLQSGDMKSLSFKRLNLDGGQGR